MKNKFGMTQNCNGKLNEYKSFRIFKLLPQEPCDLDGAPNWQSTSVGKKNKHEIQKIV